MTTLDAHLVTAGASLTPPIRKVFRGEPGAGLDAFIAYWYGGDRESTTGGRTLTKNKVEELITIEVGIPVLNRDDASLRTLDARLRPANRAIQAELWADTDLGGNAIGIKIDTTSAGWSQVGESWRRTLTIPLWVDMSEVEVIGL